MQMCLRLGSLRGSACVWRERESFHWRGMLMCIEWKAVQYRWEWMTGDWIWWVLFIVSKIITYAHWSLHSFIFSTKKKQTKRNLHNNHYFNLPSKIWLGRITLWPSIQAPFKQNSHAISDRDLCDKTNQLLLIKHHNIPLTCFTKKWGTHITCEHLCCNYRDCSRADVHSYTYMHARIQTHLHYILTRTDMFCFKVPLGQALVPLKVVAIKNIILQ